MKMGYNKHKKRDVVYMKKEKDKVYKVEIKPKWELKFCSKILSCLHHSFCAFSSLYSNI